MGHCKKIIDDTLNKGGSPQLSNCNNSSIQDSILFDVECDVLDDSSKSFSCNDSRLLCLDPVSVTARAFSKVKHTGSATAVICVLKKEDLVCANIGDSGFRLIRFNQLGEPYIVIASTEQQHDFNTPYQLCKIPSERQVSQKLSEMGYSWMQKAGILGKFRDIAFCQDSPESAKVYQAKVQEDDLLLLGSDGLFDNLFEDEILEIIKEYVKNGKTAKEIAVALTEKAHKRSINSKEMSPFTKKYNEINKESKASVFLNELNNILKRVEKWMI